VFKSANSGKSGYVFPRGRGTVIGENYYDFDENLCKSGEKLIFHILRIK